MKTSLVVSVHNTDAAVFAKLSEILPVERADNGIAWVTLVSDDVRISFFERRVDG